MTPYLHCRYHLSDVVSNCLILQTAVHTLDTDVDPLKSFWLMNSFFLIVSFYTCSDIKIHSFVNISHKNMTFSTLSYYLHVLLLLQHLSEDCIFLFRCSLLQKINSFFYHIFAPLYFFPSYISSLMAYFLVGFLSAYEVLYGTFYSTSVVFLA